MDTVETVKVKPWGKGQGDYVVINASDLTAEHELFEPAAGDKKAEVQEAASEPTERPKRPYTRRNT